MTEMGLAVSIQDTAGFSFTRKSQESTKAENINQVYSPRCQPISLDILATQTAFTKRELKVIYRSFKQGCPNGYVTLDEFKDIYTHLFPYGDSAKYATYVFTAIDQRQAGQVSFREFSVALSRLSRGSEEEKLAWVFRFFDLDNDGIISRDDVSQVVRAVYQLMGTNTDPPIDEFVIRSRSNEIFRRLDAYHDGLVTIDRFIDICLKDSAILESLHVFDTQL